MSLQYKKVLVIGATSGIGWALAAKFVQTGTSIIAVGRRKDRLDAFVKEHASANPNVTIDTVVFDISKLQDIPSFAKEMNTAHPDLDCVFVNSGMQRRVDWTKPDAIDLELFDHESLVNYTAYMHLTKAFLPYLQAKAPKETAMMYTTSGLALVPGYTVPNYSAQKAALHHMILSMRQQLKEVDSNVKVIEVLPPAVQTELHDAEMGDKGKDVGMPLKDFTDEAFAGLCSGDNEQVPVQMVKTFMGYDSWEKERQEAFFKLCGFMKAPH